ncbi:MAG: diaminopimelate epimerase, partial [Lachnospiraceae bacterium]|nr:diaminopimelate epimerase [Lachnospiraceae bacterium]
HVYIDSIHHHLDNLRFLARFVSDRHFAVGSDGMVLICPSERGDFRMRMFNPDGTEGEMCGNALRSVGKYVYDHRLTDKTELVIETLGGMQHLWLTVTDGLVSNIRADIGEPRMDTGVIPVCSQLSEFVDQPVTVLDQCFHITAVSWGNPHCAMYVDSVADLDVERYGRTIEHMTELFPNKTNVTFAEFVRRDYIKIREWERGTGETIGCGTGCCTAVVAGVLTGRLDRKVTVEQIGGPLDIEWDETSGHMFMTGPSHTVFEAEIDVPEQLP